MQPLWITVWSFLRKLKKLPFFFFFFESAIPLLGIYPEKNMVQKATSTSVFITVWFTIAKTWKKSECPSMLVLYWTGTWWSGVNNERVKEGKRLIFPGLHSWLSRSRESARNRERERDRQTDRQTRGPKFWWSKVVLMNMVWAYIPSYKAVILSRDND